MREDSVLNAKLYELMWHCKLWFCKLQIVKKASVPEAEVLFGLVGVFLFINYGSCRKQNLITTDILAQAIVL